MLHASVRAVGTIAGGPDQIHLALKDVLTSDGTLMMYASCPRFYDEVGRKELTPDEERQILEKLPPFDAATARSDPGNGILVEFLRTWPGTLVNDHVARFAAWGKHAAYITSQHPWDFAFGHRSPLERLVELDGHILLLGSDHDNVTFLHYVEHIADIADKRVVRYKVPVLENGERVWKDMEEFDTSRGVHPLLPDNLFSLLTDGFLSETANTGGRVGNAQSWLVSARALLDYARPRMEGIVAAATTHTS